MSHGFYSPGITASAPVQKKLEVITNRHHSRQRNPVTMRAVRTYLAFIPRPILKPFNIVVRF